MTMRQHANELARKDEEISALKQEIYRRDRFIAHIFSSMCHELRSPLNAILGWAHMLRAAELDPVDSARAVEAIERNAWSQARLIEDLLEIALTVTGELELDIGTADLNQLVSEVVATILPEAEVKGIQISFFPAAAPAWLEGDSERLVRVVRNMLSNSVKLTPRGGKVDVRIDREEAVLCLVIDDGTIGSALRQVPSVWERFGTGDPGAAREYAGMRLGLSLARHLVEMHGGQIEVRPHGDRPGLLYTVCLPSRPADRAPTGRPDQIEDEDSPEGADAS